MRHGLDPNKWTPVEELADEAGLSVREIEELMTSGALNGAQFEGHWYVGPALVTVLPPSEDDPTAGTLKISACKLGPYLTAGRGECVIPIRIDDEGRQFAFRALELAMTATPTLPVEIYLNGARYLLDSSLWTDFAAALVEFDVLMGLERPGDPAESH